MALVKKENNEEKTIRTFSEFLEAKEIFEDKNAEQELRLKALDYIIGHKEIKYVLRMLNEIFNTNEVNDHVYIDYAFAMFPNKPKREEDFNEMFKILQSNNAYLRNQAIIFLREYGEEAEEFLKKLLDNPDKDIRIFAINILGDIKFDGSIELLRYLLLKEITDSKDVNVIMTAVDYLGEIGEERDIELLEAIKKEFSDEPYVTFGIDLAIDKIKG